MPLAYYDKNFVEKSSIIVNPNDFGFGRGVAVFELVRAYGGAAFRLQDHLDRLAHSAETFDIKNPVSPAEMRDAVHRLCVHNKYPHSAIKFYLTAGECGQPSGTSFVQCGGFTPHLMIMEDEIKPAHPEAPYGMDLYKKGQRLKTVPFERELALTKTTNYALGYYAACKEAGKEWDDILFTRRDGCVTEATRSNFFCVIDGVLCTAKNGMLRGVTRGVLLELAARHGIAYQERDLTTADIARATEAFVTGTIAEMVPARQLDDHILPTTTDGPVYQKLRQLLTAYIAEICAHS